LFNNKIGSSLAILYHAWASALEQTGDTRKADAVYTQGIELQAQPVDWLHAQHRLLATVHAIYIFVYSFMFVISAVLW